MLYVVVAALHQLPFVAEDDAPFATLLSSSAVLTSWHTGSLDANAALNKTIGSCSTH